MTLSEMIEKIESMCISDQLKVFNMFKDKYKYLSNNNCLIMNLENMIESDIKMLENFINEISHNRRIIQKLDDERKLMIESLHIKPTINKEQVKKFIKFIITLREEIEIEPKKKIYKTNIKLKKQRTGRNLYNTNYYEKDDDRDDFEIDIYGEHENDYDDKHLEDEEHIEQEQEQDEDYEVNDENIENDDNENYDECDEYDEECDNENVYEDYEENINTDNEY